MPGDPRRFYIPPGEALLRGDDIASWQREIIHEFSRMDIDWPETAVGPRGVYDTTMRAACASLCKALGMLHWKVMEHGVTPELRTRIRHRRLTPRERARMYGPKCIAYRRALRKRHRASHGGRLHPVTSQVHADSWGWVPGVHDGLDIITPPRAIFYAPVAGEIIRADNAGWWGKGAPANPTPPAAGIVILRVTENAGPFRRGMRVCFGHCGPVSGIRAGSIVKAGDAIGRCGHANAWHAHFMIHHRSDSRGIGDRDPAPFYRAAQRAR